MKDGYSFSANQSLQECYDQEALIRTFVTLSQTHCRLQTLVRLVGTSVEFMALAEAGGQA